MPVTEAARKTRCSRNLTKCDSIATVISTSWEMQNHIVRRVETNTGTISTFAGTGEPGFSGDAGPAVQAQFRRPHSIQFSPEGELFVCDIGNHRLRAIDPVTGIIRTVAGTGRKADGCGRVQV